MERDLTSGSVFKTVVYFSLPYLLSYFLQTLYGMADLFIVGQFGGVSSTTAVSIGSQIMHMLTVMIVGLAMGSTVMIGRSIGAKNKRQAAECIGNTVTMFMGISMVLMAVLLVLVRPIVGIMSTPAEAVEGTVRYLTICFIGIPFITAYNIISSIFRGMGDSKSPMYFIAVACAANIGLDYLFIGLDAAGAALGTTIAQAISVVVSMVVILKRKGGIRLEKSDFRPKRMTMKNILKVGVPVCLQDGFIQVSFVVITIFANQRGLTDAPADRIVRCCGQYAPGDGGSHYLPESPCRWRGKYGHLRPLPQRPGHGSGQFPGLRKGGCHPGRVHCQRHRRAGGQRQPRRAGHGHSHPGGFLRRRDRHQH